MLDSLKSKRPDSPPLYKPFYFLSGLLVEKGYIRHATPNALTAFWVLLMTAAGGQLALNRPRSAFLLVLISILLDCLDGDVARHSQKESAAGSFLERIGHWWSHMALVLGIGTALIIKYSFRRNILVLASFLCISQVMYLALITEAQQIILPRLGSITGAARWLAKAVKVNYYAMPLELLFTAATAGFGISSSVCWVFALLLCVGTLSMFVPEFIILGFGDKLNATTASQFPQPAIREAEEIWAKKSKIDWYLPFPARVPPEVLRLGAMQPVVTEARLSDVRVELVDNLRKIFQTSGSIFISADSPGTIIHSLLREIVPSCRTAIMIVSDPETESWWAAAQTLNRGAVRIDVPYGTAVDLKKIKNALKQNPGPAILCATVGDLENGVLRELGELRALLADHHLTVIVDATLVLAVENFLMDEWGIDFAVSRSDCGLMSPVNTTLLAVSAAAMQAKDTAMIMRMQRLLDMANPGIYSNQGPDLHTHVIEQLHLCTRMILISGLQELFKHREELAKAVRRGCTDVLGLEIAPQWTGSAFTTAYIPADIHAQRLIEVLKEKYNIGLRYGRAPDGRETLCIGHAGWLFREDVYRIIEGAALAFAELRASEQRGPQGVLMAATNRLNET